MRDPPIWSDLFDLTLVPPPWRPSKTIVKYALRRIMPRERWYQLFKLFWSSAPKILLLEFPFPSAERSLDVSDPNPQAKDPWRCQEKTPSESTNHLRHRDSSDCDNRSRSRLFASAPEQCTAA